MDFIKKNWEKVLLGAVLVGLLISVVGLPIKFASEKEDIQQKVASIIQRPVQPIDDVNIGEVEQEVARTQHPVILDLSTSNRVVNPVQWKRSSAGQLIRVLTGDEIGVGAVVVDSISPLYLVITLDSVLVSDSGARYAIGVENQAADSKRARVKRQTYAAVGDKNENFRLVEVKGPVDQPTAVELELSDTGARVSVSTDKPFKRIDGYMADLSYPPDGRKWSEKRVGESIQVERETYNIVAITKDEVVLSARSGKKTTIETNVGS